MPAPNGSTSPPGSPSPSSGSRQWRYTLIQGTALAQLNVSPGHVPGTQWPGQLGNFAVAGHRVTAGNPFWSLPSMKDGDLVYIQTRLNSYTYRVIGKKRVAPTTRPCSTRCPAIRGSGRVGGLSR